MTLVTSAILAYIPVIEPDAVSLPDRGASQTGQVEVKRPTTGRQAPARGEWGWAPFLASSFRKPTDFQPRGGFRLKNDPIS